MPPRRWNVRGPTQEVLAPMSSQRNGAARKITWVADRIGYRVLTDKSRTFCIDYLDADGKRVRSFADPESGARMTTLKEAKAALAQVTVRHTNGTAIVKSTITVEQFAWEWFGKQIDATDSTRGGWKLNLHKHVLPKLGT